MATASMGDENSRMYGRCSNHASSSPSSSSASSSAVPAAWVTVADARARWTSAAESVSVSLRGRASSSSSRSRRSSLSSPSPSAVSAPRPGCGSMTRALVASPRLHPAFTPPGTFLAGNAGHARTHAARRVGASWCFPIVLFETWRRLTELVGAVARTRAAAPLSINGGILAPPILARYPSRPSPRSPSAHARPRRAPKAPPQITSGYLKSSPARTAISED